MHHTGNPIMVGLGETWECVDWEMQQECFCTISAARSFSKMDFVYCATLRYSGSAPRKRFCESFPRKSSLPWLKLQARQPVGSTRSFHLRLLADL